MKILIELTGDFEDTKEAVEFVLGSLDSTSACVKILWNEEARDER